MTITGALVAAAWLAGPAPIARAQTNFGAPAERHLKLDWQVAERRGRPAIHGRVFNDFNFGARDIQLLVEGLDPAGQVTSRTMGRLGFLLTPGTSGPFVVEVPSAARYRVTVLSFQWVLPDDEPLFRRF